MKQAFYADKVFLADQLLNQMYVLTEGDRFMGVAQQAPADHTVIDWSGYWLGPGLVDTHIHGLMGYDVMDNQAQGLANMSRGLLRCGVTSFLPTTLTSGVPAITDVVATIGEVHQQLSGARVQGIFIEGPFFTEKHKGAQNPAYFMPPDKTLVDRWQQCSGGLIRKVALAPEYGESEAFIEHLRAQDIVVALAHSDATYDQAMAAVGAGATVFTHTFNGMSGLHHREPGMVGAAMRTQGTYKELICDGFHVHPATSQILMDVCGRDQVVLVSDSIRAAGMSAGTYHLGEFQVTMADGQARLQDGTLAGSTLLLKDGVKNVVNQGLATPRQALNMASLNAAKSVGMEQVCGQIAPSYLADFTLWAPDMTLVATYLGAEQRYVAERICP